MMKNKLIKALVRLLKTANKKSEEKRFLILSTTGLGDTLWGTPAIRALRNTYPNSYIGILTSPLGKEVLKTNPHVDEFFILPKPTLFSLHALYRTLKKKQISDVLIFHTSQRPALPLASVIGAHQIIGTTGINKGLDHLLTTALPLKYQHEIERRLDIVAAVGAQITSAHLEFHVNEEDEKEAEKLITFDKSTIVIHPGAKDRFKQWPAEHFIALGKKLDAQLFITGAPSEKSLVEQIAASIPHAIPLTSLPLGVFAALLKRADLMITNDTGPMHLSFAMKTPTIALFSPTDPALCGPHAAHAVVLAKKPTCTPCLKKKCSEPFCMLQISVNDVHDAIVNFYQERLHGVKS